MPVPGAAPSDRPAAIPAREAASARPLSLGRSAIVHDWFQGYHGSERVVESMRSGLFAPEDTPDVLTFHAARELLPPDLAAAIVRGSRLANLPGVRQRGHEPGRWRYLLPYMPHYFESLDLERYDLVIASSHACAVNVRPRADALFVCYCHTPMRYAWKRDTERERAGGVRGRVLDVLARRLRRIDREASRRPDGYIANSSAVARRIERFYGRQATVIHPPVAVDELDPHQPKEPGRFLWVHRLVAYKRPEQVAEAFRGLPYQLTMVGIGPLEERLRARLPENVELRGWVSRAELRELYARASGFIHVGEEDFGITMVEALAAGTPVIALERGGARDIVRPGVDGVLLPSDDVATLRQAVAEVANRSWDADALADRAQAFGEQRFLDELAGYIRSLRTA